MPDPESIASIVAQRSLTRRSLIGWLAASVPALRAIPFVGNALARRGELDAAMVQALAPAVLPSELAANGITAAADAFLAWARGYRAGAELSHGYGSARITYAGADPAARWALQLSSLDADSRRAHGRPFTAASIDERRAIVRAQLGTERAASLGNVASAQHVAVALLSHFFASAAATDLCYEAHIAKNACRPLDQSPERPVRLQRGRGTPAGISTQAYLTRAGDRAGS